MANANKTPEKLADEHWRYIEKVLIIHGVSDAEIDRIGFHYRTAMTHGYKHGRADR